MGAIKAKLESFKQPKQLRAPRGRKPQTVFGPSKSKDLFKVNMGQAYSMANRMVNAANRGERQMTTARIRTEKFGGRLNNAGTVQGALDELNAQADQLLSGLNTDEGGES